MVIDAFSFEFGFGLVWFWGGFFFDVGVVDVEEGALFGGGRRLVRGGAAVGR
jgi:hypothetical protein